jgi:hypothetical protein
MDMNRIKVHFRDPTLEQPSTDYYVVQMGQAGLCVTRSSAERVLAAMCRLGGPEVLRVETITGSVVHVRVDQIKFVRESTRAQRAAERRLWKALDDEEDEDDGDCDGLGV